MQRILLTMLLFASGLCGIAYEILYGRLLANVIGDQFIVSTSVLLTFLLGIGLGARHAHWLWRKLWLIEAAIGLYALLFALNLNTLEAILYAQVPMIGTDTMVSLAVAVLCLLLPAFLIGASLPLFAGYMYRVNPSQGYFARTYGLYNVAAALTVIVIEFWLIRELGIKQAVYAMAALNGVVALALFIGFRPVAVCAPPLSSVGRTDFEGHILAALLLSSIGSAIYQLTAIRISELLFGPFRETFAYVLCIVLLGIALGSWLVNRWRISFVQLMITNIVALACTLAGVALVMSQFARLYPLVADSYWQLVALKFSCLAALTLAPAITFGATIPALLNAVNKQRRSQADSTRVDSTRIDSTRIDSTRVDQGRASSSIPGYLLYVASLANALGFLLMCLFLHQRLDYGDLLVTIALLSGLSAVVFLGGSAWCTRNTQHERAGYWGLTIALCAVVLGGRLVWHEELLYRGHTTFHSTAFLDVPADSDNRSERYKGERDVLSITFKGGAPYLLINGKISIRLDTPSEKLVGAIGAVFAPDLNKALVLGVGSGATAGSVGLLFDEVEAVEISRVILENLNRLAPYNFTITDMPNVALRHDDALHAVKVARGPYSLVLNTVTSPLFFSSSKLYTTEFLRDVQRQLAPGGLYMTWLDSRVGDRGADIMLESVTRVFDHCGLAQMSSSYLLMLCSDAPIVAHHPHVIARQPQLAAYFRDQHGIDPAAIAYQLLHTDAARLRNPQGAPLNTLDKPALAFEMARVSTRSIEQLQQRIVSTVSTAALAKPFETFDWGLGPMLKALATTTGQTLYYRALLEQYQQYLRYAQQTRQANKAGDCERATEAWQRALAVEGKTVSFNLTVGRCYEGQGSFAQALDYYRREQQRAPHNPQLGMLLGRVLIALQRYDEALAQLQSVPREHRSGAYHYLLGQTLEKSGAAGEAGRHFALAQNLSGSLGAAAAASRKVTAKPL